MNVAYKKIIEAIKKVKLTVKIKTPFVDFSFVPLNISFLQGFYKVDYVLLTEKELC